MIGEQAEGEIVGQTFVREVRELLLVKDRVITLALSSSSLASSSTAKYTIASKASRSIWRRLLSVPRKLLKCEVTLAALRRGERCASMK